MLLASNIKLTIAAAAALAGPFAIPVAAPERAATVDRPSVVMLQPGTLHYRAAGDYTRAGKPAEAPLVSMRIAQPLAIMKMQVTAADYQRCVDAQACKALATDVAVRPDHPAVQVSWRDAQSYAAWLSRETGVTYRLPTDEEWAYAAGSRWRDDGVNVDANDPSRRSLARYERETRLKDEAATDGAAKPIGSFGENENGLLDVSGNVWEWTGTCFTRTALDAGAPAPTSNCGVRVVEGRHRAYVTDFIRDARAGGCAAGIPPANLGFRLVVDHDAQRPALLVSIWRRLRGESPRV